MSCSLCLTHKEKCWTLEFVSLLERVLFFYFIPWKAYLLFYLGFHTLVLLSLPYCCLVVEHVGCGVVSYKNKNRSMSLGCNWKMGKRRYLCTWLGEPHNSDKYMKHKETHISPRWISFKLLVGLIQFVAPDSCLELRLLWIGHKEHKFISHLF